MRNNIKKGFKNLYYFIFLVMPIILLLIPLEWINNQHTICIFKNIFGVDCYGCGITRAVLSGIHFNFRAAFEYNKMVIIVLPLLTYTWIKTVISIVKNGIVLN
jgi:hypothetical protein